MEFRWLTTEEKRPRAVEIGSLPEVLALAQKLQAEGGGFVREDEVIEMGQELGVRPEYVREALRLRRREPQPRRVTQETALPATDHSPLAATARALFALFGLLLLPMVVGRFEESGTGEGWVVIALLAAAVAGWAARHPRLAGIAGATAVPTILLVATLYSHGRGLGSDMLFLSLLSLCPICAPIGRGAAAIRRWTEGLIERQRLTPLDG